MLFLAPCYAAHPERKALTIRYSCIKILCKQQSHQSASVRVHHSRCKFISKLGKQRNKMQIVQCAQLTVEVDSETGGKLVTNNAQ